MAVWDIMMIVLKQVKSINQAFFVVDGGPVQCKMFSSIHSLYPPDISSLSPSCDNQKVSMHSQMSPTGKQNSHLKATALNILKCLPLFF